MDLIKVLEQMNKGFGVDPEIGIHTRERNMVTIILTKTFKGKRHRIAFSVGNPVLNRQFANQVDDELEMYVEQLQWGIDAEAGKCVN